MGGRNEMGIKEMEKQTGISSQNIRYYEKQGLLSPKRNPENGYRIYGEEEEEQLKRIKLFRKLDMPIEDIRRMLSGEQSLQEALAAQKRRQEKEKKHLEAVLKFYGRIRETELDELQAEKYLNEMEELERGGSVFVDFAEDFIAVARAQAKREFSFRPDTMCMNSREFTDALCQYARENDEELVITKEGMYPEFTLNGIEYTAYRRFSRWGAVICCSMKHLEEAGDGTVPEKRRRLMRFAVKWMVPLFILAAVILPRMKKIEDLLFLIPLGAVFLVLLWFSYGNFRERKG